MKKGWILWVAAGAGTGFSPVAPGTVGSLAAFFLFAWTGVNLWGILLLSMAGVWLSAKAEELLGEEDPAAVVIDEWAGMALALWSLEGWLAMAGAFFFFRLFDIWKPWPVGAVQRLPGGWGVMADDWLAGILANLVVHGLLWVL